MRASRRLARVARSEGVGAAVRRVRDYKHRSQLADPFDLQYVVDTARQIFQLDITSRHESVGSGYQPSLVGVCDELLSSSPIRYEDFVFVDLGAGKGRVLMLASRFKRLIGVEFAFALVETARQNFKRFGCIAEVVHADAADYRFPDDNLVVYLYNPFGSEVLRPVLSSLRKIAAEREVFLLYLNPKNDSCVQEFAHEIYQRAGAKAYHFD